MFWKFTLNNSHIDLLLDNEDVRLVEILDEEDVLQECKGQNKKLVDFLLRQDIMEELINLITTDPAPDCDEKTRYKYPNLSCEILTCDLPSINERLSTDESLLNKIYCFLDKEIPLNPLLASFFSKVLGLLIARRSEDLVEFIEKKDDFVDSVLNHLGTSAIMDLILRLTTCIECPDTRLAVMKWLNEQQLIAKLVALVDSSVPEAKHFNVSQLLCDMTRAGREQLSQLQDASESSSDPLLDTLENPETIKNLLSHILDSEEKDGAVIVNGLAVLQTLLEFRKSVPFGVDPIGQNSPVDDERFQKSVAVMIEALVPRLGDLHETLLNPPKQVYSDMDTTHGKLNPPLGNARLQIARLITTIVGNNIASANEKLYELGSINVLLDLYHDFLWNNFLHTQVTHCISSILNNDPITTDNDDNNLNDSLLTQLFSDCKLVEKILDWWDENDQIQAQPGGHRRGFMGHLTRTANDVVAASEKSSNAQQIKDAIAELNNDYKERWDAFITGPLAEMNKKNTIDLVCPNPLQSSSEDDDADFRGIPFPNEAHMQQAFSDYQLQQMTSSFIDQFGFNEEEFGEHDENVNAPFNTKIDFSISTDEEPVNAAMFEQACNERIQQFDDADSDEDIWEDKSLNMSSSSNKSPAPTQHLRHGGQSDEDSSDEDLDSPAVIRQTPSSPQISSNNDAAFDDNITSVVGISATEQMDIDADNWVSNADEVMDAPPVAMDTTPLAWGETDPPATVAESAEPASSGWANFDQFPADDKPANDNNIGWASFQPSSAVTSTSESNSAGFADFTSMDAISSEPENKMDVSEATANRLATYAVNKSADIDMNTNGSAAGDGHEGDDANPQSAQSNPVTITDLTAPDCNDTDTSALPNHKVQQSLVSSTGQEDLKDNFTYLASAGLMKTAPQETSAPVEQAVSSKSPKTVVQETSESPKLNNSL